LGQGISGGAIKAFEKAQEGQKLDAYNDMIVQNALASNEITHEDWQKYMGSSRNQKTGIAAGIAANFTHNLAKQKAAADEESRKAMAEYRTQLAATSKAQEEQRKVAQPWAMQPIWITDPTTGKAIQAGVYDATGTPHYFPGATFKQAQAGADEPPRVTRMKDEQGRDLPMVTIWKPGSNAFQTAPYVQDLGPIIWENGVPYKMGGPKGQLKVPLTPNEVMGLKMQGITDPNAAQATPTPTPAPRFSSPGSWWSAIPGVGGGSTPTPSPSPSPTWGVPQPEQTPAASPAAAQSPAGVQETGGEETQQGGMELDAATAQKFLDQANGNPDVARILARAAGYNI